MASYKKYVDNCVHTQLCVVQHEKRLFIKKKKNRFPHYVCGHKVLVGKRYKQRTIEQNISSSLEHFHITIPKNVPYTFLVVIVVQSRVHIYIYIYLVIKLTIEYIRICIVFNCDCIKGISISYGRGKHIVFHNFLTFFDDGFCSLCI